MMSAPANCLDAVAVPSRRPSNGTSSKRGQLKQARLDDARAQVAEAEAKLASLDAALSQMQQERVEVKKLLKVYHLELSTIEADIAKSQAETPAALIEVATDPASTLEAVALWERRHVAVATGFCNLLLRIKEEGAKRFQDSMWCLWQAAEALHPLDGGEDIDPTTHSLHSYYHVVANIRPLTARKRPMTTVNSPYGEVSQRWLLSFEAMARQLKDEHATIFEEDGVQAKALKRLVGALSKGLNKPGTRTILGKSHGARMPTFGLSRITTDVPAELDEFQGSWAVLPLVWLPLALYVRSTTHLYEMLDRLHHMRTMSLATASSPGAVDELRTVLDKDQRRYSYLVFAITAALQTVVLAKEDLGRSFPYPLLASSPPDPAKHQVNGYPMAWGDSWAGALPIFRGIWVGDQVDEERTMFQYSFQSFSRQIEGAAQVLSFYASVQGSPTTRLATKHKHVLILVARQRYSSDECFALPVQLVDGPRADKSELEVLLPPFARYEFDNSLSLTSADFGTDGPSSEAKLKLENLKSRWRGFELPPLLLSMLQREAVTDEFPEIRALRPFVSVRFITRVTLAEPMYKLFSPSATRLYDFGIPSSS